MNALLDRLCGARRFCPCDVINFTTSAGNDNARKIGPKCSICWH